MVELWSSVYSSSGDYVELIMRRGSCGLSTTPVRVTTSVWTPDLSGRVVAASGCVEGEETGREWIARIFDAPFTVAIVDQDHVRITGGRAYLDFAWQ